MMSATGEPLRQTGFPGRLRHHRRQAGQRQVVWEVLKFAVAMSIVGAKTLAAGETYKTRGGHHPATNVVLSS